MALNNVSLPATRLSERRLDLAEIEGNVGGYVLSTRNSNGPDCAICRSLAAGIVNKRGDECLPVDFVTGDFGWIQSTGNEFMDEEDGNISVMLLCRDERCRGRMEELVAERPDLGIEIRVEYGPTEGVNPRR